MIIVLLVIAAIIGIGTIFTGIWIFACLWQANKREARLICSCGKRAALYNNDKYKPQMAYAYMCECGVKGYIGGTKEEAFYGWELRGNKDAYFKYITAKHGGK